MIARTLLGLVLLAVTPGVALADGWIRCHDPDGTPNNNCNASGAHGLSVGTSMLLVAGVAYGIGRRRRR